MGYAGDSAHDLVDVHLAVVDVLAHGGLVEELLDVLHSVGAVVGGQRPRLPHGVHVPHVAHGRRHCAVLVLHEVVDLFVARVGARHQVVLVEVGVVGARCVRRELPKPLNLCRLTASRLCTFLATDRMQLSIINFNSPAVLRACIAIPALPSLHCPPALPSLHCPPWITPSPPPPTLLLPIP
jgi:hypothetical protein